MADGDGEYPSLRHALQADAAINIYCGVKWLCWHLFHLLFVAFAGVFSAVFIVGVLLYRAARYAAISVCRAIASLAGPRVKRAGEIAGSRKPSIPDNESTAGVPVIRRIYGHCPVDIKMDPRWFEALSDSVKRVYEWAKPPEMVWVCDGCGEVWTWEPRASCALCVYQHGRDPDDTEYVRAAKRNVAEVHPDAADEVEADV